MRETPPKTSLQPAGVGAFSVRRRLQGMKIRGRRQLSAAVGAIVLVAIAALCWPEVRYRNALPKYRFGITAEALEREIGVRIGLRKNGNYLPEGEDDLNKRRHFCYDARVARDYVELDFNDFHELIRITKMTPLAKLGFFRECRLHSFYKVPAQ